jgi:hypothetical protein
VGDLKEPVGPLGEAQEVAHHVCILVRLQPRREDDEVVGLGPEAAEEGVLVVDA